MYNNMSAWPDPLHGTKIDNVQLDTMDVALNLTRKRVCFDKLPTRTSKNVSAWPKLLHGCFRGDIWLQTLIHNVQLDTMMLL